MPDFMSQMSGPLTNQQTLNLCSMAGIELIARKKTKVINLKRAIEQSIKEMDEAKTTQERLSKLLLGANLIKATCDAFIEMGGSMGDAAGIKGADQLAKNYSAISKTAEAMAQQRLGQKADWAGVGTAAAAAALGKAHFNQESAKDLAELQIMKVEIVNAALKNEKTEMLKSVFLGYIPKVTGMALKALKKTTAEKYTSLVTSVAKAGHSYSEALEKAFDERLSDQESAAAWLQQKQKMQAQLRFAVMQIAEMDKLLVTCGQEMRAKP